MTAAERIAELERENARHKETLRAVESVLATVEARADNCQASANQHRGTARSNLSGLAEAYRRAGKLLRGALTTQAVEGAASDKAALRDAAPPAQPGACGSTDCGATWPHEHDPAQPGASADPLCANHERATLECEDCAAARRSRP